MSNPNKYKGTIDCYKQIFLKEGIGTFYKGFIHSWSRLGPWSFIYWLTYETLDNMTLSN